MRVGWPSGKYACVVWDWKSRCMSASSEAAPDRVPASIEPLPDRPEILPHPPSAALLGRPSAIRSLDHAYVRAGRRISNSLAQTRGADLGAAFVSLSGMCSRPPAARRARHHRLQCTGLTRSGFVAVVRVRSLDPSQATRTCSLSKGGGRGGTPPWTGPTGC